MKYFLPVVVRLSSHLAFCIYVFLVKDLGNVVGPYRAAFLAYVASLVVASLFLAHSYCRRCLKIASLEAVLTIRRAGFRRRRWGWILVLTAISLLSYYGGLAAGSAASFTLFARTDAVFTFLLCMLVLGERMKLAQFFGAFLMIGSVVVMVVFDALNLSKEQYVWGSLFVISTGAVAVLIRNATRRIGEGPLFCIRMTICTLLLAPPALAFPSHSPSPGYMAAFPGLNFWAVTCLSGMALGYLFFARFAAYRIGPLWLYSALAAVQFVAMPFLAYLLVGEKYPVSTWVLLGVLLVGTVLMSLPQNEDSKANE